MVIIPRKKKKGSPRCLHMIIRSSTKKKDNVVAAALSEKYEDEGSLFSLSSLVQEWIAHDSTAQLIKRLQEDTNHP